MHSNHHTSKQTPLQRSAWYQHIDSKAKCVEKSNATCRMYNLYGFWLSDWAAHTRQWAEVSWRVIHLMCENSYGPISPALKRAKQRHPSKFTIWFYDFWNCGCEPGYGTPGSKQWRGLTSAKSRSLERNRARNVDPFKLSEARSGAVMLESKSCSMPERPWAGSMLRVLRSGAGCKER